MTSVIEEALLEQELTLLHTTRTDASGLVLETWLFHSSGQFIQSDYPVKPVKDGPQEQGACMTYARRYSDMAIVNLAPEDDDGETASGRGQSASPSKQTGGNPTPKKKLQVEIVPPPKAPASVLDTSASTTGSTETTDEDPGEAITDDQRAALNGLLRTVIGGQRETKLAWLTKFFGKEVGSTNELTSREAAEAMAALRRSQGK